MTAPSADDVSAAPHLHLVSAADSMPDDDPLIPEGTYSAVYVRHDLVALRMFKGALRLFIRFRVVDIGEHFGTVLYRAYRVKPGRRRGAFIAPKTGELFRAMSKIQPSVRLRRDQIDVRHSLKGRILKITVRTVTTDSKQRPLPPNCYYSVVDGLVGFETEGPNLDQRPMTLDQ